MLATATNVQILEPNNLKIKSLIAGPKYVVCVMFLCVGRPEGLNMRVPFRCQCQNIFLLQKVFELWSHIFDTVCYKIIKKFNKTYISRVLINMEHRNYSIIIWLL